MRKRVSGQAKKMKIKVRETSTVQPAEETPRTKIWSSNLDLLAFNMHTPSVYIYRRPQNGAKTSFFNADLLKNALSRVLVPFHPVAGRLARDKDGRIEIDCNRKGALFVVAECVDSTIDNFGEYFTPCMSPSPLIPSVQYTSDISDMPLLLLQVTYFKCGGVALGIGLHHQIADGTSGIHFINSWSEIARGLPSIKLQPIFDHTLLRSRHPPSPSYPHLEFHSHPTPITPTPTPDKVKVNYFKITSQHLSLLKSKVNSPTVNPTTFALLSAHIWICTCSARGLSKSQPTSIQFPTDGRFRLLPPLPKGYFGNVIFNTVAVMDVGELTGAGGLEAAAGRIQESAKRMDDEYLRSGLDYLEMEKEYVNDMDRMIANPNVGIVSWHRLKIRDADFGWGRPVFMGPGRMPCEGFGFLLPGGEGDGSFLLVFALKEEHMVKFNKLFYKF